MEHFDIKSTEVYDEILKIWLEKGVLTEESNSRLRVATQVIALSGRTFDEILRDNKGIVDEEYLRQNLGSGGLKYAKENGKRVGRYYIDVERLKKTYFDKMNLQELGLASGNRPIAINQFLNAMGVKDVDVGEQIIQKVQQDGQVNLSIGENHIHLGPIDDDFFQRAIEREKESERKAKDAIELLTKEKREAEKLVAEIAQTQADLMNDVNKQEEEAKSANAHYKIASTSLHN